MGRRGFLRRLITCPPRPVPGHRKRLAVYRPSKEIICFQAEFRVSDRGNQSE